MGLGWSEMVLLGLLAVVIFGKDLPRVARNVGRFANECKRALEQIF